MVLNGYILKIDIQIFYIYFKVLWSVHPLSKLQQNNDDEEKKRMNVHLLPLPLGAW